MGEPWVPPISHDRDHGANLGPAAGRALDLERPVECREAVGEAAEARAARGIGAADAVVADVDDHAAVRRAAR